MSNGINTFLRLLQGQQQAAPVPMANMQRPYQLPGGRTPPMALSGLQKAQAAQLARGTGGPAPRVLPMLADIAQGKYISPLQKALMQQEAEQPAAGAPAQTTFGQRYAQPTTQALLGAAVEGADASGWSKVPVSTGQVLARMGAGAMQGYEAGKKAELEEAARKAAADKAEFDRRLAIAQFRQKNREIEATSGKTQRAITKEQFDMEDKLFNKYESVSSENREAFFGYQKVRNAAQAYKDAAARGEEPSGASDIALLIGYMKTLDPGSVVRETEYATAKNAGGVSERVRNIFNNVRDGVILTPKLREDFIKSATTQVQPYIERQIKLDKKYTKRAKDYDLNPERVITPFLPNIFGSVDEAEKASLPVGSLVIINDRLAVIE